MATRRRPHLLHVLAGLALLLGAPTAHGTQSEVTGTTEPGAGTPPGFAPASTSWLSTEVGYVLGYRPCDDGSCAAVVRTTNGGQTWHQTAAPDLRPSELGNPSQIHVAATQWRSIGLATNGEELFASYDGGMSWQAEELPADRIGGIGASATTLYLAAHTEDGGDVETQFWATPVHRRDWAVAEELHAVVPGSLGSTRSDVSGHGPAVLLGTATFGGGVDAWSSPGGTGFEEAATQCNELSTLLVGLAAADEQYALCSFDPGRGHMSKELMVSADGRTFTHAGTAPDLGITSDLAVAGPGTIAVGATGGDAGMVHLSVDGGATWRTTLMEPDRGPVQDLAFQDEMHGVLVTGYPTLGTSAVYRTEDGGRSWSEIRL